MIQLVRVLIDSREPQWVQELRWHVPSGVQALPVGDAWLMVCDAVLAVERKTLDDFCASIADGRLFTQATEMMRATPWCYEVITGMPVVSGGMLVIKGRPTKWRWSSIRGAMLTLQDIGIGVVFCDGDEEYQDTLTWLADRSRDTVPVKARRDVSIETPSEQILGAFPGIGSGRATALLKHCGSVAWVLDFLTTSNGDGFAGVGPATCTAVRAALGLDSDMELRVTVRPGKGDDSGK